MSSNEGIAPDRNCTRWPHPVLKICLGEHRLIRLATLIKNDVVSLALLQCTIHV